MYFMDKKKMMFAGKLEGRILLLVTVLIVGIIFAGVVSAEFAVSQTGSFVNRQSGASFQSYYTSQQMSQYWPILNDKTECKARQDLILQVLPGGCTPTVVTSDLLAEQNVPVFCQVEALNLNPLLDIKEIKNIRFSGKYPDSVAAIGFHPARAALGTDKKLLGDPLINNIGYVVIVLKQNPKEAELPDFVNMTLEATIEYNSGNVLGIGTGDFKLSDMDNAAWEDVKNRQSFWNGRFSIRAEGVDADKADITIYSGDSEIATRTVEKGKTSDNVYVPGSYCQASLQIAYDGMIADEDKATLQITDDKGTDVIDVYEGSTFLNGKCRVETNGIEVKGGGMGVVKIRCGSNSIPLERKTIEEGAVSDAPITEDGGEQAFSDAIAAYERVVNNYPYDKNPNDANILGEQALKEAIKLSEYLGKLETEKRLVGIFVDKYSDSADINEYRIKLDELDKLDVKAMTNVSNIDNKYRSITLRNVVAPKNAPSAVFLIGGKSYTIKKGEKKDVINGRDEVVPEEKAKTGSYVGITQIDLERATIEYRCNGVTSTKMFSINEATTICDSKTSVELKSINFDKVAKIRLIPNARGTETKTNLSVGVGIEQRAIKIGPEKAREMMANIEKNVQKWEKISDTLGDVVEGMKTACFATSAILTFKNLFTGFSGQAIARQDVMKGWTDYCTKEVAAGRSYSNLDCYNTNSDKINKDVAEATKAVDSVGTRIETIQNNHIASKSIIGTASSIETQGAKSDVAKEIRTKHGTKEVSLGEEKWVDGTSSSISVNDLLTAENVDAMSYEQLRDLYMNLERRENINAYSDVGQTRINNALTKDAVGIRDDVRLALAVDEAKESSEKGLPEATSLGLGRTRSADIRDTNTISGVSTGLSTQYYSQVIVEKPIVTKDGKSYDAGAYIVGLEKTSDGSYVPREAVKLDKSLPTGSVIAGNEFTAFNSEAVMGIFTQKEKGALQNYEFENPKVQYYENEPYKGMPALVPIERGWYAVTRQTTPVFGGIGAFDASGRVVSFELCNVGENGRAEAFGGYGDDDCRQINLNTGASYGSFQDMSDAEVKSLVDKAVRAINEAARGHAAGKKNINVLGNVYEIGDPAALIPKTQCQDFMSPGECQLLFNLCDPVICPSSRCDLGGTYPVADVIQTGVVGGVLMCLPNVQEGIFIPVCLTGIQAGIDSYTSVLKSHRDCLNESITKGELTGICDQYTSVHLCNLFWKQAAPFVEVGLPTIIGALAGQGARGGGEYLSVQSSWDNAAASAAALEQIYGVNSLNLLRTEAISAIGDEICGGFISAQAPTSFRGAIEAHSPPQFTAWFSSATYSSATVPATGQYKVFYHIYAGKEKGVFYNVYLKNPPASGYYSVAQTVSVDSGFVNQGEQKTGSKDFTAPEGYKELCVVIDGEEKCGFGSVSTDLAVNYITDSYVNEQATTSDIKTQNECISGSKSALAVITPGVGANEPLLPELYNRGVVRICSTNNPGISTNQNRYQDVGYCDDEKLRCWLDTDSVARAVSDNNNFTGQSVLSVLETQNKENLEGTGVLNEGDAESEIKKLNEEKEAIKLAENDAERKAVLGVVTSKINLLLPQLVLNYQKAKVLLIDAQARGILAELFKKVEKTEPPMACGEVSPDAQCRAVECSGDEIKISGACPTEQVCCIVEGAGAEEEGFGIVDDIGACEKDEDCTEANTYCNPTTKLCTIKSYEYYEIAGVYYRIEMNSGQVYRYVDEQYGWAAVPTLANQVRDTGKKITLEKFEEAISS